MEVHLPERMSHNACARRDAGSCRSFRLTQSLLLFLVHDGDLVGATRGVFGMSRMTPRLKTAPSRGRCRLSHAYPLRRHTQAVKKLEEILKWLDGLNCAEKQDVTLSLRQSDTCKWLFDTTPYRM
ncbi:hypothetical protein OG21DRAFT_638819 [Imleria badia]|nr:hypothetical protein OG21DRAFT_638819 [Imleria badia]